jgi:hydroxypyruvate isomerase
MTIRLASNLLWMFTEWPLEDRFAAAASVGFSGVEYAFPDDLPPARLATLLDELGLTMVQISVDRIAGEPGLAAIPGRESDFWRRFEIALAYAVEVRCERLLVLAGPVPDGVDVATSRQVLVANLEAACDVAAESGVVLTMEAVCSSRVPRYVCPTLAEAHRVLQDVGYSNLKLVFDTYHVQMEQGAVIERLDAFYPYLGHVQIGNPPGRHEPGAGELDLLFFLAELDRRGWTGWVGCEYRPSRTTVECLDWARPFGINAAGCVSAPQ